MVEGRSAVCNVCGNVCGGPRSGRPQLSTCYAWCVDLSPQGSSTYKVTSARSAVDLSKGHLSTNREAGVFFGEKIDEEQAAPVVMRVGHRRKAGRMSECSHAAVD